VVLFALGSLADGAQMPVWQRDAFLRAFAHFPDHQFFWRFTVNESTVHLFHNHTNVHPMDWLPQRAMLGT
jgi:hypothetical protein